MSTIASICRIATIGAATWLAGCAAAPPIAPLPVVLVHGAWSDAAVWDRVAADLRARGHAVTSVNLPGHGRDDTPADKLSLAGYVDAVSAALAKTGKAVLVGHSMAGMVISAAAEKDPARVSRLVYVAAYLPQSGESLYKISQGDPDSRVGKYWRQQNPQGYSPASIAPEGLVEVFCADCSEADQQMLLAGHKAEAVPPLGTPVPLTAARWGSVPRTYVHTTRDNAVSYALQRKMVAAVGASAVATLDTSHLPMLTQPAALADAILRPAP